MDKLVRGVGQTKAIYDAHEKKELKKMKPKMKQMEVLHKAIKK